MPLIKHIHAALSGYRYELIFVNDGSSDATASIIKHEAKNNPSIKLVSFSRNFGHQMALTAGYHYARGEAVISIDADLQDPPEVMQQMLELWQQGYHIVYARRTERAFDTPFKRLTAQLFYETVNWLADTPIPVQVGDYRLLDRKVVNVLNNLPEKSRFLRGLVAWTGFKTAYVDHVRGKRFSGHTHYPFKKMVQFALDGILSFSTKPLRLATYMGFIAGFIGLCGVVYAILGKLFFPQFLVTGWAALFAAIMFMGGVQLITIGIIGEYIGKIYKEVQGRPMYIVGETVNINNDKY